MKDTTDHSQLRADIDSYSDMVLRLAVNNTRNYHDACDMTQEAFLKLMNNYTRIESPEHTKAWLIRVTLNLCRDLERQRKHMAYESIDEYKCMSDSGYTNCEIIEMLRRLPEPQRNAIYLHYYEGYTIDEIAALTGRNPKTVGSDLHRAKQRLRLELEE